MRFPPDRTHNQKTIRREFNRDCAFQQPCPRLFSAMPAADGSSSSPALRPPVYEASTAGCRRGSPGRHPSAAGEVGAAAIAGAPDLARRRRATRTDRRHRGGEARGSSSRASGTTPSTRCRSTPSPSSSLRRSVLYRQSVATGAGRSAVLFFDHPIHDLSGATLGIVSDGVLARRWRVGSFGMTVLFSDWAPPAWGHLPALRRVMRGATSSRSTHR